jgi:hypothetical protein
MYHLCSIILLAVCVFMRIVFKMSHVVQTPSGTINKGLCRKLGAQLHTYQKVPWSLFRRVVEDHGDGSSRFYCETETMTKLPRRLWGVFRPKMPILNFAVTGKWAGVENAISPHFFPQIFFPFSITFFLPSALPWHPLWHELCMTTLNYWQHW